MLFETLTQPKISFVFLFVGLLFYLIFLAFNILNKLLKNNIISNFILDITFFVIITLIFYFILLKLNYGEFRFYILFVTLIGFYIGYLSFKLLKCIIKNIKKVKVIKE